MNEIGDPTLTQASDAAVEARLDRLLAVAGQAFPCAVKPF
jgi:hypothetical protein